MATLEDKAIQERFQRIDQLIQAIETFADPAAQAATREMIQTIIDLHGAGLERMLDLIWQSGEAGGAIIDSFARDELIGNLLLLYGLHPLDAETRVAQALDKVRPYLGSHGGDVALLGVTPEGVVRLRLQGSCHGCPASAMTLELAIEEAIYAAAPDITGLEVEGVVERPTRLSSELIPLEPVAPASRQAPITTASWVQVDDLLSLGRGRVRARDVAGRPMLFCRIEEAFYAYGDTCPSCGHKLDAARLEAAALACLTCGQHYDILRAGRGLDDPQLQLEPFPLLVERGQVKVAVP